MISILNRIILDEEKIKDIICHTVDIINHIYKDIDEVYVIAVLEGAKTFVNDLFKTNLLNRNKFTVLKIKANSYYDNSETTGKVKITNFFNVKDIKGKNVLIIDDIYNSGETLWNIKNYIKTHTQLIKVCVMIERIILDEYGVNVAHTRDMHLDIIGTKLKTKDFLVGYGLNYKGKYGDFPYIGALKKELFGE